VTRYLSYELRWRRIKVAVPIKKKERWCPLPGFTAHRIEEPEGWKYLLASEGHPDVLVKDDLSLAALLKDIALRGLSPTLEAEKSLQESVE
jgi:hypothetical protein